MPSWRARLLKYYVRWYFRPTYESPENLRLQIKRRRETDHHEPPMRIRDRVEVTRSESGGFPVYEVAPKDYGHMDATARILYLHGGAFVFEIMEAHWDMIANLADRLQAKVTVPIYPLAPERKLVDIYAMIQPIYDDMATECKCGPFWVMGDSCGATLAIGLTQHALLARKVTAERMVLICPAMDCTLTNPCLHVKARTDPWLALPGIMDSLRLFKGDIYREDYRVSPLYGPIAGLPSTMLLIAGDDLLGPDAEIFAQKAIEHNVDIHVHRGDQMVHVWAIISVIPEGKRAQDEIVAWLNV